MKKFAFLFALIANSAFGGAISGVVNGTNNNIYAGPAVVTKISIVATNAGTISLFDGANVVTNAAYKTLVSTQTTVTNVYTDYFGVSRTNTYTALVTTTNTVAASTNLAAPMLTLGTVNGSVTVDVPLFFTKGVAATNSGGQVSVLLITK
jgi:ribosomal protein S8E